MNFLSVLVWVNDTPSLAPHPFWTISVDRMDREVTFNISCIERKCCNRLVQFGPLSSRTGRFYVFKEACGILPLSVADIHAGISKQKKVCDV